MKFFRKFSKNNLHDNPSRTASFTFNREFQEQEFLKFFVAFFVEMRGVPLTPEEISKFIEVSGDDVSEVIVSIDDAEGDIMDRAEEAVIRAREYFVGNLNKMFAETLQRYIEETFIRALLQKSVEYVNRTETEAFNYIARQHKESMKERMDIRPASGRKRKWSDEKLQQILQTYEQVLPLIIEAKRIYKTVAGKNRWEHSIKTLFPELPISIITQFNIRKLPAADLALSFAAKQHGTKSSEYLRQRLTKVRAELRNQK